MGSIWKNDIIFTAFTKTIYTHIYILILIYISLLGQTNSYKNNENWWTQCLHRFIVQGCKEMKNNTNRKNYNEMMIGLTLHLKNKEKNIFHI